MAGSKFVYVTFIRTSPEKLWSALTTPEFIKQYWFDMTHETDWKVGSPWKLVVPDGRVADTGEVVEIDPPRKLVLTWQHQLFPELTAEGFSRLTYDLEPMGSSVKLTVTHTIDRKDSKLVKAVSNGWPNILASLKSLLETGEALEGSDRWPEGI